MGTRRFGKLWAETSQAAEGVVKGRHRLGYQTGREEEQNSLDAAWYTQSGPPCHVHIAVSSSWLVNSCFSEAPMHPSLATSRPAHSPRSRTQSVTARNLYYDWSWLVPYWWLNIPVSPLQKELLWKPGPEEIAEPCCHLRKDLGGLWA